MKKFLKRITGVGLAISMLMGTIVLGNENERTLQEISEITGYSIEDLQEYKDSTGDMFESEVEKLINFANEHEDNNIYKSVRSLPFKVSSYAQVGDIHVTSQSKTYGVRHGHAALAISSTENLETYGGDDLSEIKSNDGWDNYDSYALMRMYSSSASYSDRKEAVEYGIDNLQGLEYYSLSSTNGKKVNCASLVTKTYKESGILDMFPFQGGLTIVPYDLVNSSHTYKVKTNNFPW